jgi:kynurenine formamidase
MKIQLVWENTTYSADLSQPQSIAITLRPNQENPNCYYADAPTNETIRAGNFVGSVAEGGTVNYTRLSLTPHGNGTHTECYGHISADANATLDRCLQQFSFVAQLISVAPQATENGDFVVLLDEIKKAMSGTRCQALVIRTLPNISAKLNREYSGSNPPYLEPTVGAWLAEQNIAHLLVDLPSVDREQDNGVLSVHKGFWQYPHNTRKDATITELVFVNDAIEDGLYLLQLQVPKLAIDAAPSQPVLYGLFEAK